MANVMIKIYLLPNNINKLNYNENNNNLNCILFFKKREHFDSIVINVNKLYTLPKIHIYLLLNWLNNIYNL